MASTADDDDDDTGISELLTMRWHLFLLVGIIKLEDLCVLETDRFKYLCNQHYGVPRTKLKESLIKLRRKLVVKYWVQCLRMRKIVRERVYSFLVYSGYTDLKSVAENLNQEEISTLLRDNKLGTKVLAKAVEKLKKNAALGYDHYPVQAGYSVFSWILLHVWTLSKFLGKCLVAGTESMALFDEISGVHENKILSVRCATVSKCALKVCTS